MKKKTIKPKKSKKTSWSFQIGALDLDEKQRPFKPVYLDKKVIYKIDKSNDAKVYQNIERDQTLDVLEALKKELGIEFTKADIQRALTIGILEKSS